MSSKRKPQTPSPQPEEEETEEKTEDLFAGRRVSVSDFEITDFDYDSVSSPGASSTSSEPGYVRQPGFEHHAHEIRIKSKQNGSQAIDQANIPNTSGRKSGISALRSTLGRQTPLELPSGLQTPVNSHSGLSTPTGSISSTGSKKKKSSSPELILTGSVTREGNDSPSTRNKTRKDPLPMKLRALPQSFWLQPNKHNNVPPSYSVLPPLMLGKDSTEVLDERPVTPPSEGSNSTKIRSERYVKVSNTDLLFSLFDTVEPLEQGERKKGSIGKRGRPRKSQSTVLPRVLRDEDPILVSAVAESVLPILPDRTPNHSGSSTPLGMRTSQSHQVLEMISLRDGDRTISLPSLNVEHNYNQLLREIVMKL